MPGRGASCDAPGVPAPLTETEVLQGLDRQQRRREAGTPVLTGIVGLPGHTLGRVPLRKEHGPLQEAGPLRENGPWGEDAASLADAFARLVREGASEALVQAFAEAARAPAEQARSAAEAFLYARLESLPATHGLFQLNGVLPFAFGPHPVEVDLLCRRLRLALEVDGWHHFSGEDAYRRDRHKDVLLQQHGDLVLRVLATDVVAGLEDVLDMVLDAVARRREGN
jgi:Protein of unknown function (DUF559)